MEDFTPEALAEIYRKLTREQLAADDAKSSQQFINAVEMKEQSTWDAFVISFISINSVRYAEKMRLVDEYNTDDPKVLQAISRIGAEIGMFSSMMINMRRMQFEMTPWPTETEIREADESIRGKKS